MASFQCMLESPFHWAAHLAGAVFRRPRTDDRARREKILRRTYLNG